MHAAQGHADGGQGERPPVGPSPCHGHAVTAKLAWREWLAGCQAAAETAARIVFRTSVGCQGFGT